MIGRTVKRDISSFHLFVLLSNVEASAKRGVVAQTNKAIGVNMSPVVDKIKLNLYKSDPMLSSLFKDEV